MGRKKYHVTKTDSGWQGKLETILKGKRIGKIYGAINKSAVYFNSK